MEDGGSGICIMRPWIWRGSGVALIFLGFVFDASVWCWLVSFALRSQE